MQWSEPRASRPARLVMAASGAAGSRSLTFYVGQNTITRHDHISTFRNRWDTRCCGPFRFDRDAEFGCCAPEKSTSEWDRSHHRSFHPPYWTFQLHDRDIIRDHWCSMAFGANRTRHNSRSRIDGHRFSEKVIAE